MQIIDTLSNIVYVLLKSGSIYFGYLHKGKPHNEGIFYWPNGELYIGEW